MSEETKKVSAEASGQTAAETSAETSKKTRAASKPKAKVDAPAEILSQAPDDAQAAEATDAAEAAVSVEDENKRPFRKTRVGVVVSDKMDKTIVVAVVDHVRHPLYKKIIKRTSRLKAHDEKNEGKIGDTVRVMETRPISRQKHWRLSEILKKAK